MATFAYRARDNQGQQMRGRVDAADERQAVRALRDRGLITTCLETVEDGGDLTQALRALLKAFSDRRHIPLRELAMFSRQLGNLLEAGVPIVNALRVVGDEVANRRLHTALVALRADLEQGHTLSEAVGARNGFFPPLLEHMVAAGEQGGFLAESFQRLADHFEKEEALNQKIRSATLYPKVVIAVSVLIVFLLLAFVIPRFGEILAGMNTELPPITKLLLETSALVQRYWYLAPLLALGITILVRTFAANPGGRRLLDQLALRLPVFGEMGLKRSLARFSRTLGTLLRGGAPILAALSLAEKTMGNVVLEAVVREAAAEVREGRSMPVAMRGSPHFPPTFVEMLKVGEETGQAEEMLLQTAGFYESDVARTAERLTTLIEPVVIVFLGGIVALVLISVFLPLLSVYENI